MQALRHAVFSAGMLVFVGCGGTTEPDDSLLGLSQKDVQVELSDRSLRRISEVRRGDQVATYPGRGSSVVIEVVSGRETLMYVIRTVTPELYTTVTGDTPIATMTGILLARDLKPGMQLQLPGGGVTTLEFVYTRTYNDVVFDLQLQGDSHLLNIDGFLMGDFIMKQKMMSPS